MRLIVVLTDGKNIKDSQPVYPFLSYQKQNDPFASTHVTAS